MFKKNEIEVKIEGMHCEHCAKKVEDSLMSLDNVSKVKVNLKNESAKISFKTKDIDEEKIKSIISELGYVYKGTL